MNPLRHCLTVLTTLLVGISQSSFAQPFEIRVVDEENGWPVPLVELRTTHEATFVTDNAGVIAFDLPELMGQETWFHIRGHGYEVRKDGFGYQGKRITPEPGGSIHIAVQRQLPGKRLGRLTGAGLFAESQKLGRYLEWKESGILGCDSVQNAIYQNQMFWSWGDTTLAKYPLGLFHMLGATTPIQPLKSFEPPVQLTFDYFHDTQNHPRVIAQMPGSGPTWLSGFVALPDSNGIDRLVAHYVKIKPPLTTYEAGLCVWDDKSETFQRKEILWTRPEDSKEKEEAPLMPDGHVHFWSDECGKRWALFGDPFPRLKIPADFESWQDRSTWIPLTPQQTVKANKSGEAIRPHRGSIAWNNYRQRWVSVFTQLGGTPSYLGEIWYAEAEAPTGPWGPAVKVVTHDNYTFYNPRLHSEFTPKDSPILLFEGTYTKQFSKSKTVTPRYEYNQILYRLDLDEMF